MKKFKVNDTVWVAHFSISTPIQIPCPVCHTNREVILILGNGDKVKLPCDYCGKGNLGIPTGYDTERQTTNKPQLITISGIEIDITAKSKKVIYKTNGHVYNESDIFKTKEEALARGNEKRKEYEENQKKRKDYMKHDTEKTFAWNAGYHLKEAKKHEKQAVYHRKRVTLCKENKSNDLLCKKSSK